MNSFRSLERAVEHEISRQVEVLESGGSLVQETRHWDEEAGVTRSMRSKEGSSDYRYFTEPDLVPLHLDREWVEEIRSSIPELPAARRSRYVESGLDPDQAAVLSDATPALRSIFDDAVSAGAPARPAANWLTGEITAWMRRADTETVSITGGQLAELVSLIEEGTVSSSAAKEVLEGVLAGEGDPGEVAITRDLVQISDDGALEGAVAEVLAQNPDAVDSYRAGETKVVGFLVGQVMRATQGKADPKRVNELLVGKLNN